jgi:hypothetical protein
MSLLAPIGLVALIGLPLIVLLHMRHFTPYERHVPTLRFWREAEPTRTENTRFRRPPLTALLVLQLLAAGLLGLALARPALSGAWSGISQQASMRHLVVILDGSTSMSATDTPEGLSRFDVAKTSALDHLAGLHEGDIATLMVLGTQVTTLQANNRAELNGLIGQLRSLEPPGGIAGLNSALKLVSDLDLPNVREEILVLSDGAVSADPAIVETLNAAIAFEQVGQPDAGNIAITDATFRPSVDNPARSDVYVQVANFGDERVSTTLLAVADGAEAFRRDLALDPNSSTDIIINTLPAGAAEVIVEVRSNDPFFADNQARLPLQQSSDFSLRILLVSDTPARLQQALSSLPGATIEMVNGAEYRRGAIPAGPFDLIVYEGEGPEAGAVPDVPMVLIDPPRDSVIPMGGMIIAPGVERIRANDPVLKDVDLTGLTFFEMPAHQLDGSAVEIVGSVGGPLIYRADVPGRNQQMIVLAFDLQQSNLTRRIAFPILIANIVNELTPSPLPSTVRLGDAVTYTPHTLAESVQIADPRGVTVELAVARAPAVDGAVDLSREVTFTATGFPGAYQLTELNGAGRAIASASFVVNAGHPQESDLRAEPDLPEILALASASHDSGTQRTLNDLWPALAALALVALLVEWLWPLLPKRRSMTRTGSPI